ncbi:MAG: P1 family peptidase [Alphaproteobacteria bacterium]|nr:P1 family peptidase [Alphaproteobacteria bacterium]
MIRPGPRNLITDVPGIRVGNAESAGHLTGTTVVLPDHPAIAAVDVRGGGPGTRETDAMQPSALVERVDAIALSGGSAFGLEAASGVASWLAARGRGFQVGAARVPIVPSAILFDLLNGAPKDWGEMPPYRALGMAACDAAGEDFALGNAGAGMGATAGLLKGGLGSVSAQDDDGLIVGALAAANPAGSAVMPGQSVLWAWMLEQNNELGGQKPPGKPATLEPDLPEALQPGANTTLIVVAVNAPLTRPQAQRVAIMAQDGIARAVRPAHTPFDGDTVFVIATGEGDPPGPAMIARIGAIAADCTARAIARGVYEADPAGGIHSWREVYR